MLAQLTFLTRWAYMILSEFTELVYIGSPVNGYSANQVRRVFGTRYVLFTEAVFLGIGYFFIENFWSEVAIS